MDTLMKHTFSSLYLDGSLFDCNNQIKPSAVLNLFQSIASEHAQILGMGYKDLLSINKFWILCRVKYEVLIQPLPDQKVNLVTWPQPKNRVDCDRDYLLTSQTDQTLIKASSKWCVIDISSRKVTTLDEINYPYECSLNKNFEGKFTKSETFPSLDLSPADSHTVKLSDIDHNGHMNNSKYADIILNALASVCPEIAIVYFQINYINEAKLADSVLTYVKLLPENKILVEGVLGDERLCFSCEIQYKIKEK